MSSEKIFTVGETFVGCGGSHFGFKKAEFKSVFVNDIWDDALKTLKQNDLDIEQNKILLGSIDKITKLYLDEKNIHYNNLDVLIGGVVCKGFSLAGIRNPYDERNYLYLEQLRLVKILRPKISIIENVPAMLNMKILKRNESSIHSICQELNDVCEAHKKLRGKLINMIKKKSPEDECKSLKDELNKLTEKRSSIEKNLEDYKYSVVSHIEELYKNLDYTVYKKVLKCSDYGCFTNRKRLFIVAVRNDLNKKWEYPEPFTQDKPFTVRDAFSFLDLDGVNNPKVDHDNIPMKHKESTVENFKKIGSKKDTTTKGSYFSRGTCCRLDYDKPAPTLVPGHSSFQIHPIEHRSITVREGSLITGFHNTFKFFGSHSSRCVQIGNAIPVQMAYALAKQCKKILES
jgi:DNA (cytosine-5)-methyltransferase 1